MMRDYVKEKVLARGRKVSIGIDVHKESWQVTAISEEGKELFGGEFLVLDQQGPQDAGQVSTHQVSSGGHAGDHSHCQELEW